MSLELKGTNQGSDQTLVRDYVAKTIDKLNKFINEIRSGPADSPEAFGKREDRYNELNERIAHLSESVHTQWSLYYGDRPFPLTLQEETKLKTDWNKISGQFEELLLIKQAAEREKLKRSGRTRPEVQIENIIDQSLIDTQGNIDQLSSFKDMSVGANPSVCIPQIPPGPIMPVITTANLGFPPAPVTAGGPQPLVHSAVQSTPTSGAIMQPSLVQSTPTSGAIMQPSLVQSTPTGGVNLQPTFVPQQQQPTWPGMPQGMYQTQQPQFYLINQFGQIVSSIPFVAPTTQAPSIVASGTPTPTLVTPTTATSGQIQQSAVPQFVAPGNIINNPPVTSSVQTGQTQSPPSGVGHAPLFGTGLTYGNLMNQWAIASGQPFIGQSSGPSQPQAQTTAPIPPPITPAVGGGQQISFGSGLAPGRPKPYNEKTAKLVPIFKGDILSFPTFLDLFLSEIGYTDLSQAGKLQLLKAKCEGKPYETINGYQMDSFVEAINALCYEFMNPQGVQKNIIEQLQKVPKLRSGSEVLVFEQIVSKIRSILSLIKYFKLDNSLENMITNQFYNLLPKVVSKKFINEAKTGNHKLADLLSVCESELRDAQASENTRYGFMEPVKPQKDQVKRSTKGNGQVMVVEKAKMGNRKSKSGRANSSSTNPRPTAVQSPSAKQPMVPPCDKCQDPGHSTVWCPNLSAAARFKVAVDLMLCLFCLTNAHTTKDCSKSYHCYKCKEKHNRYICPAPYQNTNPQAPAQPSKVYQITTDPYDDMDGIARMMNEESVRKSIFMIRFPGHVSLASVRVVFQIILERTSQWVGLLDTGANVCFWPRDSAHRMGVQISYLPKEEQIVTACGNPMIREYIQLDVIIGDIVKNVRFYLLDTIDQPILGSPVFREYKLSLITKMKGEMEVQQNIESSKPTVINALFLNSNDPRVFLAQLKGKPQSRSRLTQMPLQVLSKVCSMVSSAVKLVTIVLFFSVLLQSAVCNPDIQTTGPIIWVRAESLPIIGYNVTSHIAVISSPCIRLVDFMRNYSSYSTNTYQECESTYHKLVTSVIHDLCEPTEELKVRDRNPVQVILRRRKRIVPLVIGAIGGIISYGVLSITHVWQDPVSNQDVTKVQSQLEEQLKNIREHNDAAEKYQKIMTGNLKTVWHALNVIQERAKGTDRENKMLMLMIAQMEEMRQQLLNLLHNFKVVPPKVSVDYMSLWPNNPLSQDTPSYTWTPDKNCFYQGNDTLIMHFQIPIISKRSTILQSDAFVILKNTSDTVECSMRYQGNRYVILDLVTNCTRDLLTPPKSEHDFVYIIEDQETCIEHENKTKNWQIDECHDPASRPRKYYQLRHDEQYTYIYCYGHELRVSGNNAFVCDNTIYMVKRGTTFAIDHKPWPVHLNSFETRLSIDADLTSLISSRTFVDKIHGEEQLKDLGKILSYEKELNSHIQWHQIVHSPEAVITMSTIFSIAVAIVLFFVFRCIIRNQNMRTRMLRARQYLRSLSGERVMPLNEL